MPSKAYLLECSKRHYSKSLAKATSKSPLMNTNNQLKQKCPIEVIIIQGTPKIRKESNKDKISFFSLIRRLVRGTTLDLGNTLWSFKRHKT